MTKTVIITAGGKGLRMGTDLPKQFLPINGKPILLHTVERFYEYDQSIEIILVLPEEHFPYWQLLISEHEFTIPHQLIGGGKTRFHSIKSGLELASGELIAVHDGVRPFVSNEVINNVFEAAKLHQAAIPILPLVESIRKVEDDSSTAQDRTLFRSVQTPQCFSSQVIKKAYDSGYQTSFTDDASVVETDGVKIHLVEGNTENIKITTPFDLKVAKVLLGG